MPHTTKKLLIALLASVVILALSWIYRPFEPDEQLFESEQVSLEFMTPNTFV